MSERSRKLRAAAAAAAHYTREAVKGARKQIRRAAMKRKVKRALTTTGKALRDTGKAAVVAGVAAAAAVVAQELVHEAKKRARAGKTAVAPPAGTAGPDVSI